MRLTFKTTWLQNILFILILGGVIASLFVARETIVGYTDPVLFFWLLVGVAVLLTSNIIMLFATRRRAAAIAESRTAGLLETQKLFVELYRNSPVPYVMIDHRGRVTYPNHAAARLFGLEDDSFEGKDIFSMI